LNESGSGPTGVLLNWGFWFFCDKYLKKVAKGNKFLIKNAVYIFLNFLKGRPISRRILQHYIKHFNFLISSIFGDICGKPGSGASLSVESASETLHLCMVAIPSLRRRTVPEDF
jgi:hypothetical protein